MVNPVAYELSLPSAMGKVHNVFHVGLLKAYHADATRATFVPLVPQLAEDGGPIMEVERILDHRDVSVSSGGRGRQSKHKIVREYLVSWQGFGPQEASWEPESNLRDQASEMLDTYHKSVGKVTYQP